MSADLGILPNQKTSRQIFSYALIGVLTSFLIYLFCLLLTYLWGAPKSTMTALYFLGVSIGFFANRRFTFRHDGGIGVAGVRYLLAQVRGYLLNLVLLLHMLYNGNGYGKSGFGLAVLQR